MMQDATILVDDDGLILQLNDSAKELMRVPESICGHSLYQALDPLWWPFEPALRGLRIEDRTSVAEFRVGERFFRVIYRCLKKSSASLACGVFLISDMTEKQDVIELMTQKSVFKSEVKD